MHTPVDDTVIIGVGASVACFAAPLDVDALLQGYLRSAKAAGATLVGHARVTGPFRQDGVWTVQTADGRSFQARRVVYAAGAWADELAVMAGAQPLGLQPSRRSAFLFEPPPGVDVADWPAGVAADESWYFKPAGCAGPAAGPVKVQGGHALRWRPPPAALRCPPCTPPSSTSTSLPPSPLAPVHANEQGRTCWNGASGAR